MIDEYGFKYGRMKERTFVLRRRHRMQARTIRLLELLAFCGRDIETSDLGVSTVIEDCLSPQEKVVKFGAKSGEASENMTIDEDGAQLEVELKSLCIVAVKLLLGLDCNLWWGLRIIYISRSVEGGSVIHTMPHTRGHNALHYSQSLDV